MSEENAGFLSKYKQQNFKNNPDKSSENEKHVAIKIAFINFQELLLKKSESDD